MQSRVRAGGPLDLKEARDLAEALCMSRADFIEWRRRNGALTGCSGLSLVSDFGPRSSSIVSFLCSGVCRVIC